MDSAPPQPQLPRILLIDDDAISREVVSMVLGMHGFAVESAEDGAEALATIHSASSKTAPEVILMDTQMPGLSGLDLIAALRKSTPARLIAISGSRVSDAIRNATDGFLLKPVEAEALLALLASQSAGPAQKPQAQPPAPVPTSDQAPDPITALDPAVLDKLRAMMPAAALEELYAAVASDLEKRLVTLETAMNSGEADEVRRIAHAIKGGCAMVGLSGAASAASRLETSNRRGTWKKELLQIHSALIMLQSILCDRLLK